MTAGTVAVEFPDFDDTLPVIEGFEDSSWHNDASPSMMNKELHLLLWIDYVDPARSEFPDWRAGGERMRFMLEKLDDDDQVTDLPVLAHSDNIDDIVAVIDQIRAAIAPKSV